MTDLEEDLKNKPADHHQPLDIVCQPKIGSGGGESTLLSGDTHHHPHQHDRHHHREDHHSTFQTAQAYATAPVGPIISGDTALPPPPPPPPPPRRRHPPHPPPHHEHLEDHHSKFQKFPAGPVTSGSGRRSAVDVEVTVVCSGPAEDPELSPPRGRPLEGPDGQGISPSSATTTTTTTTGDHAGAVTGGPESLRTTAEVQIVGPQRRSSGQRAAFQRRAVQAGAMLSRLVKFRKDSPYEDLEGDDKVEMDITDMYREAGRTFPPMYSSGARAPGTTATSRGPRPPHPAEGELTDMASVVSTSDETYTVEQAIDQIGFGMFQVKLSVLTGFAWMADAMEMMILAILSPALHCDWQLTGLQEAAITTVVFCGMMSSSGLWGSICDKYGRKTELILCSLVTFYFGILSAFSPTYFWLLILRGLVGFGIGGAPQAVTLYAEFLPSKTRATCVTLVEVFWAIGACFEVLLALVVMPTMGWQWLLGFSALPLLVFAVSCVWLPESARYDLTRGCYHSAVKTLERIAKENGKPMPLGKLVEPVVNVKRGRLIDLLAPDMRLTTILLWIIWLVCAFSYYGIVLLTTALFENPDGCHGTDVKFHSSQACFAECKTLTRDDYKDLTWTTFAEFPGLFLTAFLLERIGRKYTMVVEFGAFSIFVLCVNICMTRALLTVFLFVARAFISGAFQGAYIYTPEFYPTSMRAMGLGACSGMARIGAIVTPFVAQVLLKDSAYLAVSLYGVMCLVAAIASYCLPYETKGREMKDTNVDVTTSRQASDNSGGQ